MTTVTELEAKILDAALLGDKNALVKLKADLAYSQLSDAIKQEHRLALIEFETATARMNAVIEQIPDRSRGLVIEMLKRDHLRLRSMGF